MIFGQIVVGPPGSGKSTYVHGAAAYLKKLGRKVVIVNLDPANENCPYQKEIEDDESGEKVERRNEDEKFELIDISELIRLEDVMTAHRLGPNGGLVFCMEFLRDNFEWLKTRIEKVQSETLKTSEIPPYLLIDCPGQIELYTHNDSVKEIIKMLEKVFDARLVAVNLVDSHSCSDASKFVSICLTSLGVMLQTELPHLNVLNKIDLLEKYGKLDFNVDFYTDVLDLKILVEAMPRDPFMEKMKKLNDALADVISNYALVQFAPLHINSRELMVKIQTLADKANGYCFGSSEERTIRAFMTTAMAGEDFGYARTGEIRENFMDLEEDGNSGEQDEDIPQELKILHRPQSQV